MAGSSIRVTDCFLGMTRWANGTTLCLLVVDLITEERVTCTIELLQCP